MTRHDPFAPAGAAEAAPPPPTTTLARQNVPANTHYLFHTKPGDVVQMLKGNVLILGVFDKRKHAWAMRDEFLKQGIEVSVDPWLKAPKSKSMWTVLRANVSQIVADQVKEALSPASTPVQTSAPAPRTPPRRQKKSILEIVDEMPGFSFEYLLQSAKLTLDDPRGKLRAWCEAHPEVTDWRVAWPAMLLDHRCDAALAETPRVPLPPGVLPEDVKELIGMIEAGRKILLSVPNLGLPTIHDIRGAEHRGFGLFQLVTDDYSVTFDAGGAMQRTKGSRQSYTYISESRGVFPYDREGILARLRNFATEPTIVPAQAPAPTPVAPVPEPAPEPVEPPPNVIPVTFTPAVEVPAHIAFTHQRNPAWRERMAQRAALLRRFVT